MGQSLPVTARLFLGFILLIVFGSMAEQCMAQQPGPGDFGYHHHLHHDWYSNKFNRIGRACCNGTTADQPGDCRPTRAKYIDGKWFALVDGEYREVPDYAIMPPGANHEPFQFHVCANKYTKEIDCFFEQKDGT